MPFNMENKLWKRLNTGDSRIVGKMKKKMCPSMDKALAFLFLICSVLIAWNWGLQGGLLLIWGVVDVLFVALPILYLYNCCSGKKKEVLQKKLTEPVFLTLALIAVVAVYQVAMGRFGKPDVIWDYLDAFAVIFYAFLAGKLLR